MPVYEGYSIPYGINRPDIAGRDLTNYLMRLLNEDQNQASFTTTEEHKVVCDMKEKLCYVSLDCEHEIQSASNSKSTFEKPYELPDGKIIALGNELF